MRPYDLRMFDKLLIKPGKKIRLSDFDPSDTSLFKGDKDAALEKSGKIQKKLGELQELVYAERKHKVLIVLQGMDTSGKDGTIRHVMGGFDPQGVKIATFKKPTEEELDHDFLWRVHKQAPGRGEIVVFNRSHYEDVLIVRVHSLVPEKVWRQRYQQINDFERLLAESGTTILKFFLHISKEEQRERLEERIADSTKRWKFQHTDLEERKLWDEYMRAYDDAIEKTSTECAPWVIVPSDKKWYRNLVIGTFVQDALKSLKAKYPVIDLSGEKVV